MLNICVDIDECDETTIAGIRHSCKAYSTCANSLDGTYAYNCGAGYESDDAKVNDCTDIDECTADAASGNQHNYHAQAIMYKYFCSFIHLYMQWSILDRRWYHLY